MDLQINWLAVLLATLASMVVGSVWYAPPVFGRVWMRLIGKSQRDMQRNGWLPVIYAVIASAMTAFVLAHFTYLADNYYFGSYSYLSTALITAFWVWLGFAAMRFWTHDSFEGRPLKLTLLNAAHELTTFMAMGLVIGLMGV